MLSLNNLSYRSPQMADDYIYTWESLSEKDAATVKRCFGSNGTQELVRFFIVGINEISKSRTLSSGQSQS